MFFFEKSAKITFLVLTVLSLLLTAPGISQAKAKYLFKVGSLAPEGSVWITQFNAFARDVSKQTNGEVGFRIYSGGTMGDDLAMYRKMRVSQLHGGGFTMSGISSVVPDFRVLAIPFQFDSYEEVDYVTEKLTPAFKKAFAQKGLVFLSFTEVGFVYPMSKEPIITLENLKNAKSWIPSGDPLSSSYLEEIGITPTQLTIPDVLSSLQTGLVNTVYNSLYGAIVLQWFTSFNYICEQPYGYAYGAIVLDGRKFKKLPAKYQEVILTTADKYFPALNKTTRQNNADSMSILKENGIEFVAPDAETIQQLKMYSEQTLERNKGKFFSEDIYQQADTALQEYRSIKK